MKQSPHELAINQAFATAGGHKFRHQHPAGPYALDFYCAGAALCIEVDGKAHDMGSNPQRDERRDAWLAEQGIRTIRIPAVEILRDIEPVLQLIELECTSRSPANSSPRFRGEGDHAKHGGGATSARKKPLHRLRRSPSPAKAGEELKEPS